MKNKLDFSYARTCYNHLAGKIATDWFIMLEKNKLVSLINGIPTNHRERIPIIITQKGKLYFKKIGYEGSFNATICLDGIQKKPHISGKMGKELLNFLLQKNWVKRNDKDRTLIVVPSFKEHVNIPLDN